MASFNHSTMQMTAKVVYYGPGLGGKTTNLQYIYDHTSQGSRGEMVMLETEADRTLFFDLLPLDVGSVAGFRTRVQLYTVPGQVFYNTTRKLVLRGVDGVVFVADSQRPMLKANIDSLRNLQDNLRDLGRSIESIPMVLQYNKRDLPDICSLEDLNRALNPDGRAHFPASALTGRGVFDTLKAISRLTLLALKKTVKEDGPAVRGAKPSARGAATGLAAAKRKARRDNGGGQPRQKTLGGRDVMAELEAIRRQALGAPITASGSNGEAEITREIELSLSKGELARARRFSFSLQVEDEDHQVVDVIRDLRMDLESGTPHDQVRLRLNIALSAKE